MPCETLQDIIDKYSIAEDVDYEALKRVLDHGIIKSYTYLEYVIDHRGFFKTVLPHAAFGWVTRSGKFYSCGYGGHEIMLDLMGIYTETAEVSGWLRVSGMKDTSTPCFTQGRYRPTVGQKRTLKKMGAWEYLYDDRSAVWQVASWPDDIPIFPAYE